MPNDTVMDNQNSFHFSARWHHFPVWFLVSAALILLGTALLKFISALQEVQVLGRPDPLFWFVTKRQLLIASASLEATIACFALKLDRGGNVHRNLLLIFVLSSVFLCYRLVVWWSGYNGECSCFGNAAQWLGSTTEIMDLAAKILLGYLLVGSGGMLMWRWLLQ